MRLRDISQPFRQAIRTCRLPMSSFCTTTKFDLSDWLSFSSVIHRSTRPWADSESTGLQKFSGMRFEIGCALYFGVMPHIGATRLQQRNAHPENSRTGLPAQCRAQWLSPAQVALRRAAGVRAPDVLRARSAAAHSPKGALPACRRDCLPACLPQAACLSSSSSPRSCRPMSGQAMPSAIATQEDSDRSDRRPHRAIWGAKRPAAGELQVRRHWASRVSSAPARAQRPRLAILRHHMGHCTQTGPPA